MAEGNRVCYTLLISLTLTSIIQIVHFLSRTGFVQHLSELYWELTNEPNLDFLIMDQL